MMDIEMALRFVDRIREVSDNDVRARQYEDALREAVLVAIADGFQPADVLARVALSTTHIEFDRGLPVIA